MIPGLATPDAIGIGMLSSVYDATVFLMRFSTSTAALILRDCTPLIQSLAPLIEDGSHLLITRYFIPQRVLRMLRNVNHSTLDPASMAEDHAILTQVFVAVDDSWGLLQVRFQINTLWNL